MEAYKQTVDTVTKEVSVNTETGLTQQEAQQRLKEMAAINLKRLRRILC